MMLMNLKQVQHLLAATQGPNHKHDESDIYEQSPDSTSLVSSDDCSSTCTSSTSTTGTCEEPRRPHEGRRVSFNHDVVHRTIPCIDDYSREEIELTWFLPEESFKIHQSCIKQISMIQRGETLKGIKYCARGLESCTFQAQQAKKQNRRAAYDAVLDEQDEQQEHELEEDEDDCYYDDEAIAELYREVSASCQMWAHVVAMKDQRDAELIYDEAGIYDL